MALFNKKTKEAKQEAPQAAEVKQPRATLRAAAGAVLLSPRVTEKGTLLMEKGAYVFNVAVKADKRQIARAVQEIFKVAPREVKVLRVPGKKIMSRMQNRMGRSAEGKKAYVFLKQGDKIEIA